MINHDASRCNVLGELKTRFLLLQEQYTSDIGRLDTISEAGRRLGQLAEERCPVCGSLAEHHDSSHKSPELEPDDIASSCDAEASKIRILLAGLAQALADNQAEGEALVARSRARQADFESLNSRLQRED